MTRPTSIKNMFFVVALLGCCLKLTKSQKHTFVPERQGKELYYYKSASYTNKIADHIEETKDEKQCLAMLNSYYEALVIERLSETSKCYFFYEPPTKISKDGFTYVIKSQRQCSEVCSDLQYMNLCGNCYCNDTCSETNPRRYVCDCRKHAPIVESCAQAYENGYDKDGLYLIDPSKSRPFTAFCKMNIKFKPNNDIVCPKELSTMIPILNHLRSSVTYEYCLALVIEEIKKGDTDYVGLVYNYHSRICYRSVSKKRSSNSFYHSCMFKYIPVLQGAKSEPSAMLMMLREIRGDGSFWDRPMADYVNGFGGTGDRWIGLENLHQLTSLFVCDVYVVMISKGFKDHVTHLYQDVSVASANEGYMLSAGSFNSLNARKDYWNYATNRFASSNGEKFQQCNEQNWWVSCNDGLFTPMMVSQIFGFGQTYEDVASIGFYVVTREKRT